MARLEALQIQGFRSFGPDERDPGPQVIKFGTKSESNPLTLIVGQNGCGKTTIIECLRYATSGDVPPGASRGASFVHDPKMAKERETCGTVKLLYQGTDGCNYTITRSLTARVSGKSLTTKTLDTTIRKKKPDGSDPLTLSGKCADMNQHLLMSMGVSKAILNYVVFCHQDDSLWPLDEGSKVKAKFDEIFASSKYNGCLQNIKEVRKKHLELDRMSKKDLDYLKETKQEASDKRKQLRRKRSNQEAIQTDLTKITEAMVPLEEELKSVREVEQNFSGIQAKMTEAKTNLDHFRKEIKDLRKHMESEISTTTHSDVKIKMLRDELDGKKGELEGELNDKEHEMSKLETEIAKNEGLSRQILSKIGECKAKHTRYENDKAGLSDKLVEVGQKFGFDLGEKGRSFTNEEVYDVISNLHEMQDYKRQELKETERKFQEKIDHKISESSNANAHKAQLEEKSKGLRLEKVKCKKDIAVITRKLAELQSAGTKLQRLRDDLDSKEKELEEAKQSVDLTKLHETLIENKNRLKKLELESKNIQENKKKMEVVRDQMTVISQKQKEVEVKESSLEKLLSRKNSELLNIFGGKLPETRNIKRKFYEKSQQFHDEKKELEEKSRQLKTKQQQSKETRRNLMNEKREVEARIADFEREIEQVIDAGSDFEMELEQAKNDVDKTRSELQSKEANKFTFKDFVSRLTMMKTSKTKPSCPTCNRNFDKSNEVDDVIEYLNSEINKIPGKVNTIQQKLNRHQTKVQQLQDLLPEKKRTDELKQELESISEKVKRLDKELKEASEKSSIVEDKLEVVSVDYSICDELIKDEVVIKIDQLSCDALSLKGQIADLQDELPQQDNQHKSYNELMEDETTVSNEINELRQRVESDQTTEIEHERTLNKLNKQRNELFNEKLQIESNQQERTTNEDKKKELEGKVKSIDDQLVDVEEELSPIASKLSKLNDERFDLEKRKKSDIEKHQKEIEKIRQTEADLKNDNDVVARYEESDNETNLVDFKAKRDRIAQRKTELDADVRSVRSARGDIEKQLHNQAGIKRNYEDNLKLRDYLKKEKDMASKERKFEEQLNMLDHQNVKKRKEEINKEWLSLENQKMRLLGQDTELSRSIKDIEDELSVDKFKYADEACNRKEIEIKVRQYVIKDLNKYYIALDWAILRFHKERMEQINRIVRELWKSTYKGNDIDYIEVKTEDADTVSGADSSRKKYNYRVVMIKNDTELEMRGRSSAGQRVLASLIIRLALAETFSIDCGMIA